MTEDFETHPAGTVKRLEENVAELEASELLLLSSLKKQVAISSSLRKELAATAETAQALKNALIRMRKSSV